MKSATPVVDEMRHFRDTQRATYQGVRRLLAALIPEGAAIRIGRPVTRLVSPLQRRRAQRLWHGCDKVHLGSGEHRLEGWVNVDLIGRPVDVAWDLTEPLPFPTHGVGAIFTEHVIEHLHYDEAVELLAEARRVLRPGGVLRVVVPDAGRHMRSYADDLTYLADRHPDASTKMLGVADILYRYGHLSAWDGDTLVRVLTELGLHDVRERSFRESSLDPCPDQLDRQPESLYVEGIA